MATLKKLNWFGVFIMGVTFLLGSSVFFLAQLTKTDLFIESFKVWWGLSCAVMMFYFTTGLYFAGVRVTRSLISSLLVWLARIVPLIYVAVLVFFSMEYPRPTDLDLNLMTQHYGSFITASLIVLLVLEIARFLFCESHFKIIGDQMVLVDGRIYYPGELVTLYPWLNYDIEQVPNILYICPHELEVECSDGKFTISTADVVKIDVGIFKRVNTRKFNLEEAKRKFSDSMIAEIIKVARGKTIGQLILESGSDSSIIISPSRLLRESQYLIPYP